MAKAGVRHLCQLRPWQHWWRDSVANEAHNGEADGAGHSNRLELLGTHERTLLLDLTAELQVATKDNPVRIPEKNTTCQLLSEQCTLLSSSPKLP